MILRSIDSLDYAIAKSIEFTRSARFYLLFVGTFLLHVLRTVPYRNKKYISSNNAVMQVTNLSMADTIFKTMKEKYDEIESKKLNRELIGEYVNHFCTSELYSQTHPLDKDIGQFLKLFAVIPLRLVPLRFV